MVGRKFDSEKSREVANIILEYLKVLAWPIAVIIIAIIFKSPLINLIERLKKANLPGGVSLDFDKDIKKAQKLSETVKEIQPPKDKQRVAQIPLTEANKRMIELGLRPVPSGLDLEYYKNLAIQDPNIALVGLRIELEIIVNNLIKGWKIEAPKYQPIFKLIRLLFDRHAITSEQSELLTQILIMCNKAAHGKLLSIQEAIEIIDLTDSLKNQYISWLSWGFEKE